MKMQNSWLFNVALTALVLVSALGFGVQSDPSISRPNFIAAIGGMVVCAAPVAAKDDDSLKGTKKDPAFEQCLSLCMYECTKPKGVEQKSRAECLPECKEKCATSKAQLLTGEPKSQ